MKTRSASKKSLRNTSQEKIGLPQSFDDKGTQIKKVYAERGKSNDNFQSPIFNIHVHVTNSNKNSSHPSSIQPIIHLHIGEKELEKLSQKKPETSPIKRQTRRSPCKARRKSLRVPPQQVENQINTGSSDFKNSLITDYMTFATPLTSKSENKNSNLGKSLDSKSEISNTSENSKIVFNDFPKEEQNNETVLELSAPDHLMVENENESNVNNEGVSPSLLSVYNVHNLKEVSVVLKDINCEKNIHSNKNCPKKSSNRIAVTTLNSNLFEKTNFLENKQDTLEPEICQGSNKEKKSNDEQNCKRKVSVPKKMHTNENNSSRNSHYYDVYSSSEESFSTRSNNSINERQEELVEPSSSTPAKSITSNDKQLDILNDTNKKLKTNVRTNLQQKFTEVETQNEKIANEILSANENTLSKAEELKSQENSNNERNVSDEDDSNVSKFDSSPEISPKKWSTESVKGYNFSEILQKLRRTSENERDKKNISASPSIRESVEKELERLFSDEEKDEKKEIRKENKNKSPDVLPEESSNKIVANSSDKNKKQESHQENCASPLNDKKESLGSDSNAESTRSKENFSNHNNKCDTATESFSLDTKKPHIEKKKEKVSKKKKKNGASLTAQENVEQTLKLHSHLGGNFEEEEIEERQKKKKSKKKGIDEISDEENSKQQQLINPFRLMDDKQVVISGDPYTKNSADTVSLVAEKSTEKERNEINNEKKERSSSIENFSKTMLSVNPFHVEEEINLKEKIILENNLEDSFQNSIKIKKKKNKSKSSITQKSESNDLQNEDKNSSETSQSSVISKRNVEETNDLASLVLKKIQELSEESEDKTIGFFPFDAENKQKKKKKGHKKLDSIEPKSDNVFKYPNGIENNNAVNDNMSEDESNKTNENNSHLSTTTAQKDALLVSWSSEDSLFREKVIHKKHKKKRKTIRSSKCTDDSQADFTNVNNSKDEKVNETNPDSDDEPALVIDDFSESEISFFFDEIDSTKKKKNINQDKVTQNELCNFSPKSTGSTSSKDMFLSQGFEVKKRSKKSRVKTSTKKKTKNGTAHFSSPDLDGQRSENIKRFLDFDSSPTKKNFSSKKQENPVEDKKINDDDIEGKKIDEDDVEIEVGKTSVSTDSDEESMTNESEKSQKFSPDKEMEKELRENKLEKIKKWIQDNPNSPHVSNTCVNPHIISPTSESQDCCESETKKKRKRNEENFEKKKSEVKKKKSRQGNNQNKQTVMKKLFPLENDSHFRRSSEKTQEDVLPQVSDSEADNNIYQDNCQITSENSDKFSTTQPKDLNFESEKKEKSPMPKIFLKVIKNQSNNDECQVKKTRKKKSLKSFNETSSLDFQLNLIKKEMNKRGIIENEKKLKKKIKKKGGEKKIVKEVKEFPTIKKKRKKKKMGNDEFENSISTKKTKSFEEEENYIPLEAEGPTKFSAAILDKIKPYNHTAAEFKEKMFFGDRVKRFSKSNTLSVKKAKQKATRERFNDYQ